jgi:hypothetical protein
MRSALVLVWAVAALGLMSLPVARAEGTRPPAAPSDPSDQGTRQSKAEAEVAAAWKKMRRAQRKSKAETTVTVIPLKSQNVRAVARAVKKLYRHRPGFAVAALPELRCVMVRADAKTKEEVLRWIVLRSYLSRDGRPTRESARSLP